MSLAQKTLGGFIWTFISIVGTKLSTLVVGIILARLLEPEAFGLAAMLYVFLEVSQVFVNSGFAHALIREKELIEEDKCTTFYSNLGASLLFYVLLYFSAPAIADFYVQPELVPLTRVMGLVLFAQAFTIVHSATLSNQLEFKKLSIAVTFSNIGAGIIAIIMAYRGFGVWAIGYKYLFTAVIKSVIFWVLNPWLPRKFIDKASFKKLFGFGSKLLLTDLLARLFNNVYKIIIGKAFSAATLGFYTQGQQYIQHLSQGAGTTLKKVTYPVLSKTNEEPSVLNEAYKKIVLASSFIIFPAILSMIVLAEPLLVTLVGEKWLPSVPFLQILGFGTLVQHLYVLNQNILKVQGRSDQFLKLEALAKVFTIVAIVIGIQFGIWGLLAAKVISDLITFVLSQFFVKSYLEFSGGPQIVQLLGIIGLCIPTIGLLVLITFFTEWNEPIKLLVGVVLAAVSYLAVTYFLKSPSLAYILELLEKRFPVVSKLVF